MGNDCRPLSRVRKFSFACNETLMHFQTVPCINFILHSKINLRGGSTNRAFGGEIFFAEWYYCHPEYDPIWLDNDIGLISISPERPIQGVNIQIIPISPICATNCCEVCEDENDLVTITGWGVSIFLIKKKSNQRKISQILWCFFLQKSNAF